VPLPQRAAAVAVQCCRAAAAALASSATTLRDNPPWASKLRIISPVHSTLSAKTFSDLPGSLCCRLFVDGLGP
jgi:hypothetical protein